MPGLIIINTLTENDTLPSKAIAALIACKLPVIPSYHIIGQHSAHSQFLPQETKGRLSKFTTGILKKQSRSILRAVTI